MSSVITQFLSQLAHEPALLVTVQSTRGSVPREVGAWMAVFAHSTLGTVGGGHLEWQALPRASERLAQPEFVEEVVSYALGPTLGQCCGGAVELHFQRVTAADTERLAQQLGKELMPVAVFGAGHVGRALVQVLATLPMDVTWIDSRDGIFGSDASAHVHCEQSAPVQSAVVQLAPQSRVLIMSFSHGEDFDLVAACLTRQRERADLPFIGLIGSKTKWATFRNRLLQRGFGEGELQRITCPIGIDGIADKRPAVIAVAVAAQLLRATAG
ncbi:MAG: xanthine dehydrogenase accessory protein XdhC [Burkholderiales bacterium]|nr:xanthine dehydrogenase accessory protein XdhC [Burkholderiales bacterium]